MSKTKLMTVAVMAVCFAGSANAQMASTPPAGDPMTAPTMAPDYVKDAGAGDKFEIDARRAVAKAAARFVCPPARSGCAPSDDRDLASGTGRGRHHPATGSLT